LRFSIFVVKIYFLFTGIPYVPVRDNVIFGTPFNEELYNRILRLTGMDKDITQFQYGDQTVIGEKVELIL